MGLPISPHPPAPAGLLDRFAAERVTGTLSGPHGCLYLLDGAVYCIEGTAAPGLDLRLTASGKLPPQGWQYAAETAGPQQSGGQFLVGKGWLTQGELEICHLAALLDAAFFALPLTAEATTFTPGTGHWLGVIRPVSATALQQATAHRRLLLDRLRPWAAVDSSPVVPVHPHPPAPTTSRQRRLLALADGRHTPYDLARALGQSAFGTLLDVRRLAAAGLVRVPRAPTPAPLPRAPAPAPLPRRRPGAALGAPAPDARGGPAATWQLPEPDVLATADPNVALLVRLRTALEENL
ncbi:hypothetical protein [Streptomyces angustmyceticus]|uniref:hypothetical protein n=1 Tax=Streptomyces angustmyceticus TaxID=285578 RepID=UPI0037F26DF5